jgi:signal transduction histidine kinase/putative methionine-R-sulfoxide reductase with GAF domain
LVDRRSRERRGAKPDGPALEVRRASVPAPRPSQVPGARRTQPPPPRRTQPPAPPVVDPDALAVGAASESTVRALAVEVTRLRHELERAERRVDAMKQIGRALGSNLALEPLLFEMVARTTELLEADRSTLFLVDRERNELTAKVVQGADLRDVRLPLGVGIAGWVAEHGEPVHIQDAYNDVRLDPEVDRKSGYKTRSMLVWPVRRPRGDRVIGVMQVLNKRAGSFDGNDERLLEAIASEIGVALEVSRLYGDALEKNRALERTRGELMLLIETERLISSGLDQGAMLRAIIDTARERLGAKGGFVHLLDERGTTIEIGASAGLSAQRLKGYAPTLDDPFLRRVMLGGAPVIENAPEGVARGRITVRRLLAAPIITPTHGTIGVIELVNKRGKAAFGEADAETLAVVAAQAGRAIVAERERTERERGERLTTIGRMLSGVVHDLRTPLTLIGGYATLMAGQGDHEERARHAQAITRQIDVMSAMTRDLLAFARGESSLLVRKVYVDRFMAEMRAYLEREFEGTGVCLEVRSGYKGVARFDESKLLRVFHNIARNAREAMPRGGTFSVGSTKQGTLLEFSFADTGAGIPADVAGRVFEPFVTSGKQGGTGLGLAMVKRIAEEHRGEVSFESAPGRGTTFTFRLPMA